MAGPFGLLGNGGSPGLLGNGFMDQMQQNRQQTLGRAPGGIPFAQNPVVTALGAALVGGKNMAGKYDMSALPAAMGARTAMQGQMQAKQDAEAKRRQMSEIIKAYPNLSLPDRAFYMANPEKFDPASMKANAKDNLIAGDKPLYNAATGEWIQPPAGGSKPFEGSALDAQDSNILLTGDPSSPEYGMAYYRQYLEPKFVSGTNEDGTVTMTPIMPQIPPNIRSPSGDAAKVAQGGANGVGEPIVTGTKQASDTQAAASLYAQRMKESHKIITDNEAAGTSLMDRGAAEIPVLGNYIVSDDYQAFEQAQRDFINATLRRESGAVINPEEFLNAEKQYFPQPGDNAATLAQKRRNREVAIEGIERAAGPLRSQSGPPASARPSITNPATGEKLMLSPDGKSWVPANGQ